MVRNDASGRLGHNGSLRGLLRASERVECFLKWVGDSYSVENNVLQNPTSGLRRNVQGTVKRQPGFPPTGLQGGQALAEFAFAFPLQLLILFAIMQLALLYVAKQVVTYASYSAARAAMVSVSPEDAYRRAERASALVCAPITGPTVEGSNFSPAELQSTSIEVPGWGRVPRSGISYRLKTHVSRLAYPAPGEVQVTVTHYYELVFPVVNHLFAWLHRGAPPRRFADATGRGGTVAHGDELEFEDAVGIWNVRAPHMRLRETTRLAVPGG